MPYVNNKSADQPAHPCSLISAFVVRCLDRIYPLVSISEISSHYLAPVSEQAGLSLPWSKTLMTDFLVTKPFNYTYTTERLTQQVPYGPGHAKMCLIAYANNKGADQSVHLRSLISTFVVRCLNSMTYICYIQSFKILASFCS